jgi:hypothetical protein
MTISGGPSRPTIVLMDDGAVTADEYHAVKCVVEGFRSAFVRVVCDKSHDIFVQGIAYEGGDAADLVVNGTAHYAETTIAADTGGGRAYLVPVETLYQLQVVVHNADTENDATATVEVTLA